MRPPVRRPMGEAIASAARTLSAAEIVRASWDLQSCPVTGLSWSAPTMLVLYGPPGSGKSTLACQIAAQCAPVTIASLEESPGPPMARRLSLAGMGQRRDVSVAIKPSISELLAAAHAGHALVIDSVSMSTLTAADLRGLCDAGAPLLLCILHVTKSGAYRGSTSVVHEADVVLRVEEGGAWASEKNRYGASGIAGTIRGVVSTEEQG